MSQTQGISQVFTATLKSGDRFDYTQWRQEGLPKISLKELAEEANTLTNQLGNPHQGE